MGLQSICYTCHACCKRAMSYDKLLFEFILLYHYEGFMPQKKMGEKAQQTRSNEREQADPEMDHETKEDQIERGAV